MNYFHNYRDGESNGDEMKKLSNCQCFQSYFHSVMVATNMH